MSYTPAPPSHRNTPRLDRQQARVLPQPGDVLYFHHENAHAIVTQNGQVSWLEHPVVEPTTYTIDDVATAIDIGNAHIIEGGFDTPEDWFEYATTVSQNRHTDPRAVTPGGAPSTKALTLSAERGSGSKYRINGFLKHPEISYKGDVVGNGFKIALTAQYNGNDVAMAVLGKPTARLGWDDANVIQLLKFAAHPDRPQNTGSWLLSKAYKWAELECYDTFLTYAGEMNENTGVMYSAANFDCIDVEANHDGDGWTNRENREGRGTYTKRTWIRSLCDEHEMTTRRRKQRNHPISGGLATYFDDKPTPSLSDLTLTREEPLADTDDPVTEFIEAQDETDTPIETEHVEAVFGARHGTDLKAAVVLVNPSDCPNGTDNFSRICITHTAIDDVHYPTNILRWLVGNARDWAHLHGYQSIEAITPQAGTTGIYNGAQFNREAPFSTDGGSPEVRWQYPLRT